MVEDSRISSIHTADCRLGALCTAGSGLEKRGDFHQSHFHSLSQLLNLMYLTCHQGYSCDLDSTLSIRPLILTLIFLLTSGCLNPFDHLFVSLMAPMVYVSAVGKRLVVNVAYVCALEGSLLFLKRRRQPCSGVSPSICKEICY